MDEGALNEKKRPRQWSNAAAGGAPVEWSSVELAGTHSAGERGPLGRGERQDPTVRVLRVPHGTVTAVEVGDLDAVGQSLTAQLADSPLRQ